MLALLLRANYVDILDAAYPLKVDTPSVKTQ